MFSQSDCSATAAAAADTFLLLRHSTASHTVFCFILRFFVLPSCLLAGFRLLSLLSSLLACSPCLPTCWLAGLPGFLRARSLARLLSLFFSFACLIAILFCLAYFIALPAAKNRRRAGRGETVASGVSCSAWRRGGAPRSCHLRSSIGKPIAAYHTSLPRPVSGAR